MRFCFALAVCGTVLAVPAAAQNGISETPKVENPPAVSTPAPAMPPPGPSDDLTTPITPSPAQNPVAQVPASTLPEAATTEAPVPQTPAAETPAVTNEKAVTEAPPATTDKTVAEAPPPAAPAPLAQTPAPAPEIKPPAETKAVESPPADTPQTGATAESKPSEGEGRFTFNRVTEGFLRLDTRTGQVAFCSKRSVGWTCQLTAEDRGALEGEISRLEEENSALKKELVARGLPVPEAAAKPEPKTSEIYRHPTDPDLDRMKVLVEEAWRRLVDMILTFQRDVLKKS